MKMVIIQQPGSLESLALDALVTYIYEMSEHATVDICQRLKLYLSESIPPTLADEVTAKLLSSLNRRFKKKCEGRELVEAVILPAVTTLDFKFFNPHICKLYEADLYEVDLYESDILPILLKKLDKLPNLRKLRIIRKCRTVMRFFPSSLVEFTCTGCDLTTLKSLSECCKLLRKLHMPYSNFFDGDFVELILTFKHLEDLNLKDVCAWTTEGEPLQLVETLTRRMPVARALQLKKFGCTIKSVREFEYLMHQIIEFHLNFPIPDHYISDLLPGCTLLANLKHLKSLHILCENVYVDPILDVLGSQLTHLNMRVFGPFDVCKVVEKCTSVQFLHLSSTASAMPVPSEEDMRRLPPLKYLKCLSLKFPYQPSVIACFMLVCNSVNVEVLKIVSYCEWDQIVNAILNKEPMIALKELTWYSCYSKREQILKIVERCPNLEILRGTYVWNRQGNEVRKEKNYLLGDS